MHVIDVSCFKNSIEISTGECGSVRVPSRLATAELPEFWADLADLKYFKTLKISEKGLEWINSVVGVLHR